MAPGHPAWLWTSQDWNPGLFGLQVLLVTVPTLSSPLTARHPFVHLFIHQAIHQVAKMQLKNQGRGFSEHNGPSSSPMTPVLILGQWLLLSQPQFPTPVG